MSRQVVDVTAALLRPVRSGNALEATLERLLVAVRLGVFPEGARLPAERELAARLAVSRMTLREALRALQAAGYVEARRGRYGGTFVVARWVAPPDEVPPDGRDRSPARSDGLEDALALREVVEVGAAAAAARRAARTDRPGELVAYLEERLEACRRAPAARYASTDARLHLAIAEATGSSSAVAALAEARARLHDHLATLPLSAPERARSDAGHEAVVAAVRRGDAAAAAAAMAAHLEGSADRLRRGGILR